NARSRTDGQAFVGRSRKRVTSLQSHHRIPVHRSAGNTVEPGSIWHPADVARQGAGFPAGIGRAVVTHVEDRPAFQMMLPKFVRHHRLPPSGSDVDRHGHDREGPAPSALSTSDVFLPAALAKPGPVD